ncbi:MAG: 2-C-methyl-D-erythritol 4-phosphate cytidylyltransferase [Pseudomonadales bacterium]|jgi:2-C-methyl-D-erythritol 4-phosphate cytidylyltransferase|nr:2-C-methyl-D-erythritol 4-phosphate cytidylyltransferase [Pseudomonadales bacterium]
MYKGRTIAAIINCAGSGTRFGKNKLVQTINIEGDCTSKTVIAQTVRNFVLPEIDEIIVTVNEKYRDLYEQILITDNKLPVKLVIGGHERYASALNGLEATKCDYVLIHDGVRPFASSKLIKDLLETIDGYKAAMLAVQATTTIKKINPKNMTIEKSLRREESWLAQTPQLFERQLLIDCYKTAMENNYQIVSDDSELITSFSNEKVKVVPGDETNIKITFPIDLEFAQIINSAKNKDD